jgi:hypothetical protein
MMMMICATSDDDDDLLNICITFPNLISRVRHEKLQKCTYSLRHACQSVCNNRRTAESIFIKFGIGEFDTLQMWLKLGNNNEQFTFRLASVSELMLYVTR